MASKSAKAKQRKTAAVPRITKLDAVEFDDNIRQLLGQQLNEVEKYMKPGLLAPIKPEIELLLDVLIFRNSILKLNRTFGQDVLNLQFSRKLSNYSSCGYALSSIILPYMKRKCDESGSDCHPVIRSLSDYTYKIIKIAQLINLLIFLRRGLYPTLTDRILGLTYINVNPSYRRANYNYMMRTLLWHSFMELIVISLPLINIWSIKRKISSLFYRSPNKVQVPPPTLDLNSKCAVCQLRPISPCRISLYCQHAACYLCIKGSIIADEKFCCPECRADNTAVCQLQFLF